MGANTLGHLDPEFVDIMNNVGKMLRRVFRTKNQITGAISATGTAGMEARCATSSNRATKCWSASRATFRAAWSRWPVAWAPK
jgi:aspartate aminotransferase-like enzyme